MKWLLKVKLGLELNTLTKGLWVISRLSPLSKHFDFLIYKIEITIMKLSSFLQRLKDNITWNYMKVIAVVIVLYHLRLQIKVQGSAFISNHTLVPHIYTSSYPTDYLLPIYLRHSFLHISVSLVELVRVPINYYNFNNCIILSLASAFSHACHTIWLMYTKFCVPISMCYSLLIIR